MRWLPGVRARRRAPATSPPSTPAQATPRHDPDPRDVLDKLGHDRSLADFIQAFTIDLGLEEDELAVLAGVSTETIVWCSEGPLRLPDDLEAVSTLWVLRSIATLLIGDGEMAPCSVAGWLRSGNRDLSSRPPLDVLRHHDFSSAISAAEAVCDASTAREQGEIR